MQVPEKKQNTKKQHHGDKLFLNKALTCQWTCIKHYKMLAKYLWFIILVSIMCFCDFP